MQIQLSDHFDCKRLFRFVLPSIIMMIFTSVYGVVDGFFVSNFVGKTPFAAINLIMPVLMILGSVGFMIGTGGSALVARTLGEKKTEKANSVFSLLVYMGIALGVLLAAIGFVSVRKISIILGADENMVELCVTYSRIILAALPFFMLQNMFQSFLVTAEKPKLGLLVTIISGVTNMVLDAVFIAVFNWGIAGAAAATAMSQFVGGAVPLIYFARKNSSTLKLTKTKWNSRALFQTFTNGSSEFVTNISISVVSILYNFQLMKYAGENGIAAYGVIMYVSFIFTAIFVGYSIGVAPIIGYNQGADNDRELKNIFKKSMTFVSLGGIVLTLASWTMSRMLSELFVGYDAELLELTVHALKLYSCSFVFSGFAIFGSAMFTALNNGLVSATISFMRTLFFQTLAIIIMPMIWGIEGAWYSIIVSEACAAVLSVVFIVKLKKKYKY